jgi:hypothetical protein
MKKSRFAFLFTSLLLAAWVTMPTGASGTAETNLTFSKDVAPIFYKNCVSCHRAGEIAPMSLITYKEVRPWARAIREKVITRDMPPWHADPKHGEWANDRRMSQKDIDTIAAWVNQGAKEGNPKDLPPAPKFATGWQIGEPDAVFYMPEEYTVPADGGLLPVLHDRPGVQRGPLHRGDGSARGESIGRPSHSHIRPRPAPEPLGAHQDRFRRRTAGRALARADAFPRAAWHGEAHKGRLEADLPDALHA